MNNSESRKRMEEAAYNSRRLLVAQFAIDVLITMIGRAWYEANRGTFTEAQARLVTELCDEAILKLEEF